MSRRTKFNKSRYRLQKSKEWKTSLPYLYEEVPTYSRSGRMYSKRVNIYKVVRKAPYTDFAAYLRSLPFIGGLFR